MRIQENLEKSKYEADGSIQISAEELNFKTVKIGEQKKMQVTLKNSANCAFFVDLQFRNNRFE